MNYQPNIKIHEQIAKAIFENGLLKQQLLERGEIIDDLKAEISQNTVRIIDATNAAAETREQLNMTIVEREERISELEGNVNTMNEAQREQAEQLQIERENLATISSQCEVKDEKIKSLNLQLNAMEVSKDELAKQKEESINLLKATCGGYYKTIEENKEEFKILNDKIKDHMKEIKRMEHDHTKEIKRMEQDFGESLKVQADEYLKQVTEKSTKTDELRVSSNQTSEGLGNAVDNVLDRS